MFLVFATVLSIAILAGAVLRGGHSALRGGWIVAMVLLPTSLEIQVGSLLLDLRAVAGIVALVGLCIGKKKINATRPTVAVRVLPADLLVVGLVAVLSISQWRAGRFGPLTVPDIARRWLLPYVMGRVFYQRSEEIESTLPWITKLLTGLAVYSILESILKVNVVNVALGKTFGLLEQGEGYRWGLKRAQGPLEHPIFFGMLLVLVLPWTIEAGRFALSGRGPKWWIAAPILLGGAILGTVSRGAQISAVGTVGVALFFYKPRWRAVMLVVAMLGGFAAVTGKEAISGALSKWAGENQEEVRLIEINGEEVEYTGTNHRILLFKVYEHAIAKTGAFGYGYELRGIELEESIAQRFGSIDDHYILFLLQHGYAALVAFLILGLVSLFDLARTGFQVRHPGAGLAGALFGAMLTVTISLLSVWFSPDFGAVWLFCAGVASNLRCLPLVSTTTRPETATESPSPVTFATRTLVPGHAPKREPLDNQEGSVR